VSSTDSRPSIAVLPFENRSDERRDIYFVDGIHDDILTQLAKVSALKVISRTSVERFRDTRLPMSEIGRQLGVEAILEGGVQRAGNRVRVTVQLINSRTDAHLWAESYDRQLTATNIFSIQSEVASAIAVALKAALTAAEKLQVNAVPTRNLAAWEAYQLGRQRMANRTTAGLAEAGTFFQRAIRLDPKFALAYVGLADAIAIQANRVNEPVEAVIGRAERALQAAIRLDPNLAEAWATSGLIAASRGNFERAEQVLRRAIELNPNYAPSYQWLSGLLADQGRQKEALVFATRAVELDPLSPPVNLNLGSLLESLGRLDEAEARYRKVIEIDPSMTNAYLAIGLLDAYRRDRFATGAGFVQRAGELDPDNPVIQLYLTQFLLDLGDDDGARRVIGTSLRRWPENEGVLTVSAILAIMRGDEALARHQAETIVMRDPRSSYGLALLSALDLESGEAAAAKRRYAAAYPELLAVPAPSIDDSTVQVAIDLACVLQKTGDQPWAGVLLDRAEALIRPLSRAGVSGDAISPVEIYALRGQNDRALSALTAAVAAGWRGGNWAQRYYRDIDPNLSSIREEPRFKAAFAVIERDMAVQRALIRGHDAGAVGSPAR
jgi:TolB-like protein/Flp pilus assembly protein TadD